MGSTEETRSSSSRQRRVRFSEPANAIRDWREMVSRACHEVAKPPQAVGMPTHDEHAGLSSRAVADWFSPWYCLSGLEPSYRADRRQRHSRPHRKVRARSDQRARVHSHHCRSALASQYCLLKNSAGKALRSSLVHSSSKRSRSAAEMVTALCKRRSDTSTPPV